MKRLLCFLAIFACCMQIHGAQVPVISPPLTAATERTGANVGFVTHPHEAYYDLLSTSAASAELANIFVWRTVAPTPTSPEEIQVDFNPPAQWLKQVYNSGRRAYPILDTSNFASSGVPWLYAMTGAAGENLVGADGQTRPWCSFHSPLYQEAVYAYIDQLIDWTKLNDHAGRVAGYTNGAEWFWPGGTMDYSPRALEAWTAWLKKKYLFNLNALNTAWGAQLTAWNQTAPPRLSGIGANTRGWMTYALDGSANDLAWAISPVAIEAGATLSASVNFQTQQVPTGLAAMQIAWLTDDALLSMQNFSISQEDDTLITAQATAPAGATRAQLLLKLLGPGTVTFGMPVFQDGAGQSLLTGNQDQWWFAQWAGEGTGSLATLAGQPAFEIQSPQPQFPYEHMGVALEDWVTFSYESMAGWLNETALHIKQRDPSRPVGSYVGFVFGLHSMWDYTTDEQRLDISLANTPDIDVNGIQLAVADEDFTYATAPLDMARKYGKTLRATDLVDFPYGLYSGFAPIYRGAMACVQHGLDEVFFYNWHGTPDYSFFALLPSGQRQQLLNDLQTALAAVRGYELNTPVAMLMPIQTFSLADQDGYKSDALDAGGFYHLLLDAGLTPDLWTPYEIGRQGAEALEAYKVIFVPDCPVLPAAVNTALVEFAQQGGVVIGAGRVPSEDLAGTALTPALANELPTYSAALGQGRVLWRSEKMGRPYWGKVSRQAYYGNTPPVYLPDADTSRTPASQAALRLAVHDLLQEAAIELPVQTDPAQAGVNVSLFARPSGSGVWLVFVVRHGDEDALEGVTLTVRPPFEVGRILARPDLAATGQTLTQTQSGQITLPAFTHTCLVQLSAPQTCSRLWTHLD